MRKINIVQGEYAVSSKEDVVITTLLGSCIAACIFDDQAAVGGMNHFLLPGEQGKDQLGNNFRYGVQLMEVLINGLLRAGATRERLRAKIFGGANTVSGLADIGAGNIKFVREYLLHEDVAIIGGDTGGFKGRRLQFWPVTGRARQILINAPVEVTNIAPTVEKEREDAGALELF